MKKIFEIVYSRLLKVKEIGKLCPDFWRKIQILKVNYNEDACWLLLTQNIEWILNTKEHYQLDFDLLSTNEIKEWFSSFDLEAHNIYFKGEITVNNGFAIGLGEAKINATGHSKVILFDNATAECYDTSFVFGYNQSSFVVNDCIGNAFHNCKSQAKGLSIIESWSSIKPQKSSQSLIVDRS